MFSEAFIDAVEANTLGTILGGIILSFVFFLIRDKCFKLPNINGNWNFDTTTLKTQYNPYRNMKLTYSVLLWQSGNAVFGTGEKIFEVAQGQSREYVGEQRSRVRVTGYISKRYLGKDEIVLHFEEQGAKRMSSTIHVLKMTNSSTMEGHFMSTIANSEGTVAWSRGGRD